MGDEPNKKILEPPSTDGGDHHPKRHVTVTRLAGEVISLETYRKLEVENKRLQGELDQVSAQLTGAMAEIADLKRKQEEQQTKAPKKWSFAKSA